MAMKILKCYPFKDKRIRLVEGFKVYDGYLGDKKGVAHKGIDYVLESEEGRFTTFDVFSAHDGEVFQGRSKRGWGRFVIIYKELKKRRFVTVYAHLAMVHPQIPSFSQRIKDKKEGFVINEGRFLGKAGITGWTKRKIQLHFELQIENKQGEWIKIDPYGVDDVVSSRRYPQPGHSLRGLEHFWTTDNPHFADRL